ALHDSAEIFPQPKCHPETRTKMLKDLRKWSMERDGGSKILWLYGPAGAGKSAIMQTLARKLQAERRLGGSFFFKRGDATRGNAKFLFATIAYQLAIGVRWLKAPISRIVEEDPSIIARSIETQLQTLISEPYSRNCSDRGPLTILIDGLDECEGQDVHKEILRAIRVSSLEDSLCPRFLIASRPEAHIQELFESPFNSDNCCLFNMEKSFDDVRAYLRDEFARIHREHRTMAGVPHPWPSPDVLKKLVSKSSGHFIYASTVIKFIDDKNYRPTERLAVFEDNNRPGSDSAFDALDQLYMNILAIAPRRSELIPILCAITNFDLHPDVLDQVLGLERGDSRLILRGLHSVLEVPPNPYKRFDFIYAHHASFLDFLDNEGRSRDFYAGGLSTKMDLAGSFLELFADEFHKFDGYGSRYVSSGQNNLMTYICSRSPLQALVPFITSLPPTAKLLSVIPTLNPDYIFEFSQRDREAMLSWIKVSFCTFRTRGF
ncbi:hypothetical protein B0H13DRAFT_1617931, partial [Mycena leptocephala]